ncbi:hypothetical protein HNP02_001926 [Mycobacterium sp. AZCC_0083]|nr:hypothetical protein [Mycobacterium sp. AZCC_0083]
MHADADGHQLLSVAELVDGLWNGNGGHPAPQRLRAGPHPGVCDKGVGAVQDRDLGYDVLDLNPVGNGAEVLDRYPPAGGQHHAPPHAVQRGDDVTKDVGPSRVGGAERHQGQRAVTCRLAPVPWIRASRVEARAHEPIPVADPVGIRLHHTGNEHQAAGGRTRYVVERQLRVGQPVVECLAVCEVEGVDNIGASAAAMSS